MYKIFVFVVMALLASETTSFRIRRQSDTDVRQAPAAQSTTTATSSTTAAPQTEITAEMQRCITGCPVTPEYNPVCGTNGVLYPNPGRLLCAQACGVNVSMLRVAPCPRNN